MHTPGKHVRILAILALIGWMFGTGSKLYSQTILSGAALENACQEYADKAVRYAREWESLDCQKKLSLSPQLMDTDRNYHYTRCRNSVGTTIGADLQSMEKELIPCRGTSGGLVAPPTTVDRPPLTPTPPRRDNPPAATRSAAGDLWDIVVINSADLARSEHSFRIGPLNGQFRGQNTRAGGPEFDGQTSGSIFEAIMTDRTGYRANFVGHFSRPGLIEGTGCDNRGRSYSFSMTRR